jgi:hypothetical protein
VTCHYCRTTSNALGNVVDLTPEIPDDIPPSDDVSRRLWLKQKAWEGFEAALAEGGNITFESLRDASRAHLATLGETDALARVVWGLVQDFEVKEEIALGHDADAWTRLSKGYVAVVEKLAKNKTAPLLVPFLIKRGPNGHPLHLDRELTVSTLQALAERDPHKPRTPPAEPEKKKGFWSKLLS